MGLMIDKYGLVRAGTDGGDSCHRTYSVLMLSDLLYETKKTNGVPYLHSLLITPVNARSLLEAKPGLYIRSPDPDWTSSLRTASRDQLTPVICYLALRSNSKDKIVAAVSRKQLSDLLKACLKRGMFAQNDFGNNGDDVAAAKWKMPDFINPDLWAIFASGYVKTAWAPLAILVMLFGDAFAILGAMLKVWGPKNKDATFQFRLPGPNDVDDMNANNCHLARMYAWPTPLSYIARKIYKTFRKKNYGNEKLGETSAVMGALAWYNHDDNTDITELYRPLVEKY